MKSHGKKMFPGINASNIFFLDNQKNIKIDPKKYINKTKTININKDLNNKIIKDNTINKDKINIKIPIKKRVLKKYNSTTLKKGEINPFSNQNDTIKKHKLTTHRSFDYLKTKKYSNKIALTEPNINGLNISANLKKTDSNKIKVKHRILGSNNKINESFNSKTSRKPSENKFSSFTYRRVKQPEIKQKIQPMNYYNKFINKSDKLNESNKKIIRTAKTERNNNYKYSEPKEEIFIIKKEKLDNEIIDINSLKKSILGNGINIVSLTGISSSLVPINKDSVKLIINSKDIDKNKLHKIERILKNKGLKLNEQKNNFNKKYSGGIFPAKSKWNDGKYGGRENKEKFVLSMEFKKNTKENKFHKNSNFSKNNSFDFKYKNKPMK